MASRGWVHVMDPLTGKVVHAKRLGNPPDQEKIGWVRLEDGREYQEKEVAVSI